MNSLYIYSKYFKKCFCCTLLMLICTFNVNASDDEMVPQNGGRAVFVNDTEDVDSYRNEIQKLTARIELLEHAVSKLNAKLEQLVPIHTAEQNISDTNSSIQAFHQEKLNQEKDVFDLSTGVTNTTKFENETKVVIADDKKMYDSAMVSFKDNKFADAESQFKQFLSQYSKSKYRANAHFWYAETFFRRNLFDNAAIEYLKCYKQFPKSEKASDALLKLSLCLGKLNKKKEACAILSKLDAEFKNRSTSAIKRAKDAKISFGCK